MANKDGFNFQELNEIKFPAYKKKYFKPMKVKNASAGILLINFKLGGGPKTCIFLPFKKMTVAKVEFERIGKESIHPQKFISLVAVSYAKEGGIGEVTLTISPKAKKLSPDDIIAAATPLFEKHLDNTKLNVIGSTVDANNDTDTDTDTEEDTIKELRKEFQEAKNQSKQISKADPKTRVTLIEDTWNKLEVLMPKLAEFISNSEKEGQKQTATKITEAAKTIQATLKPHIEKIKASGNKSPEVSDTKKTEKSNANLDTLTSGISKKAAQLLAKYQQEIADFDQSSDDLAGDSLADKLKSISQIA